MPGDAAIVSLVTERRCALASERALLVGISGIDGSGKTFIAQRLTKQLRADGHNVVSVSADDWLNLPSVCLNPHNPAPHFYEHALRLDEMFSTLALPLQQYRSVDVVADCGDARATAHWKRHYLFSDVDIVILEGIFLFKRQYRDYFDLKVWIETSFTTALRRAIDRGQEGLPPGETEEAFNTIYFPAQRIHFAQDRPAEAADIVIPND